MARRKPEQTEVKLNLTPMIDVTFLLLIFFMCAMKFKTLERKVAAYLPKDRGQKHTSIRPEEPPKIEVTLKRTQAETRTRIKFMDTEIGQDDAGFARLQERIKGVHASEPDISGFINAWPEVPHRDVVRTIDAFMQGGVTSITFRGTEKKGTPPRGPTDPNRR